jgi:hypothetical protein
MHDSESDDLIESQAARIAVLERRIARLEAALRFVERGGEAGGCPACGCGPYDTGPFHSHGCELATALGLPTIQGE